MRFSLVSFKDYAPEPVAFLWPERVPFGGLTILEGPPGGGKSTVLCDIAARFSTGRMMYGASKAHAAGAVVWLNGEDFVDSTARNLAASGADLAQIHVHDQRLLDGRARLALPDSGESIASACANLSAKLIVIDPLTAFVDGNLHGDAAIRRALQPLASYAARSGAAIILVRHWTKTTVSNALYQGAGSTGLIAIARSCLAVVGDPTEQDSQLLCHVKSSAGRKAATLRFQPKASAGGVIVDWQGISNLSVGDILGGMNGCRGKEIQLAMGFVVNALTDGSMWAGEIQRAARANGISERTLRRAADALQVIYRRHGGGVGSRVYWELPQAGAVLDRLRQRELDELANQLFYGAEIPRPPTGGQDDANGQPLRRP